MRGKKSDNCTAEVWPPVSTAGQVAVVDVDGIIRREELNVSSRILMPVLHQIVAVGLLDVQRRDFDISPVAATVQVLDIANGPSLL